MLEKTMPEETMTLDFPPPNPFMPRKENLKCIKAERANEGEPGIPELISKEEDKSLQIWYKQDDSFEQPFIYVNMRILTKDCGFPTDPKALILSTIWESMMVEHFREIGYMASLGGINAQMQPGTQEINFRYSSYNDMKGVLTYFETIFKQIRDFEVDEAYLVQVRDRVERQIRNKLLNEPYQTLNLVLNHALSGRMTTQEQLEVTQKLTVADFHEFKKEFLKNSFSQWLVMGHIQKEEALDLVLTALDNFKSEQRSKEEMEYLPQVVALSEKTVIQIEQENHVAEGRVNPNSAIVAYFQD